MATVYIQPGSGTGTGTEADPYYFSSQLTTADTAAGSGGTILFTDGNYNPAGTANLFFTAENVTYKSLNPKGAYFDYTPSAGGLTPAIRVGWSGTSSGTATDGITFSGFYLKNHRLEMNTTSGTTNYATLDNVHVFDTVYTIHTNIGGIGRSYYNGTTTGDTFVKVKNSTFVSLLSASADGVAYPDSRWTFDSCSFYWSKSTGTPSVSGMNRTANLKNCIFVGDSTQTWSSSASNTLISNSTNCCIYDLDHTSTGGTDNIFVDPQFVDLDSGDFRLRPTSPCIGAGTAS